MNSCVAIITYNRLHALKTLLCGLTKHCPDYPIGIFEDCGQKDGTETYLRNSQKAVQMSTEMDATEYSGSHIGPNVQVFLGDHNLGVTGNSNRAIHWFMKSGCDHLCLLNDDLHVLGDFVNFYDKAHTDLGVGLFCFCDFTSETYRWLTVRSRGYTVKLLPRMTGIMMSFTKAVVDKIGYYDARFGKFGEEHSCPAGSLVTMGNGTCKPIERIQVGDVVLGWVEPERQAERYGIKTLNARGKWAVKRITRSVVLGTKSYFSEVVRVTTQSGKSFVCTPDHLWMGAKWKPVTPGVGTVIRYVADTAEFDYDNDDYKRGYLQGALMGDGSLRSNETILRVDDMQLAARFAKFVVDIFGKERLSYRTKEKIVGKTVRNHISVLSGRKSLMTIDEIVLGWDDSSDCFKRGWLAGIYDTEGHGRAIGQDRDLNADVYNLILRYLNHFKFKTYLQKHQICIKGGMKEMLRFMQLANPVITSKLDRSILRSRFSKYDKIVSVEPVEPRTVYCLKTSTGNYVVHGYASKNCDFTIRARIAGFVNLDGQQQNCLDVEVKPPLLRHQEVETSMTGKERVAADQEASTIMRQMCKLYGQEHYYRPFMLHIPRVAGGYGGGGIPVEQLREYKLVQSPV